jgi:hypothetical protein
LELGGDETDLLTPVSLTCRGITPEPEPVRADFVPLEYLDREEEFSQLISRGMSCAMCQRFWVEFSAEEGIVLWADEEILDQFSLDRMEEGSHWKIFIGREVDLTDDDKDGWDFVTEFLDHVLLGEDWSEEDNPGFQRWVTVLESEGIWATRPASDNNPCSHGTRDGYEPEFLDEDGNEGDLQEGEEYTQDSTSSAESDESEESSTGEECSGDEEVCEFARDLPQEILDVIPDSADEGL